MNQQKDKTNRTKIGFYENYYDQSGRLLYVSKEQKPKPEITRLINDEPVDYGLILKQDLQKRHLSLNKDKDHEVSNKLNYHQVSHKGGDLKDRKADWQKVIRDDRQQNHYWYVKNHKKTLHHRGRLFTGLFLIWFLIGAIGFMSIVTGKLWEMSIKE